jgi:hypothetical protein
MDKNAERADQIFLRILPIYRDRPVEARQPEVDLIKHALDEAVHEAQIEAYNNLKYADAGIERLANKSRSNGLKEGLLLAAGICRDYDEVTMLSTGKRFLEKKTSNNVNGLAYAEAIEDKAREMDTQIPGGLK